MSPFYTYLHMRASDGRAFYVGKGRGRRAESWFGRSAHWQRTATKHGLVTQILAFWETEEAAFEHERFLILCFKEDLKASLVNITAGGEGSSGVRHSAATRQKMSVAHLGRKLPPFSATHRAKLAAAQKGRPPGNKGCSPSLDTRARQSAAKLGTTASPATKAKMSAAHKEKQKSVETRAKMSAARRGRAMSEATKQKLSVLAKERWAAKAAITA